MDFNDDDVITNEERELQNTIQQAPSNIQPMVVIFNEAIIQDGKKAQERQIDYSVTQFKQQFPQMNDANFYRDKWDDKLKDARCFFMLLQQHCRLRYRSVSTQTH